MTFENYIIISNTEDRIKLALELTKKYCTADFHPSLGGPMFSAIMEDLRISEDRTNRYQAIRMRGPG